jgi:hypothetical protein
MNIKHLIEQATTIEEYGWGASYEHFDKEKFAELVAAHTLMNIDPSKFIGGYQEGFEAGVVKERQECIQNVLQQYEGFGTEHQGVEYVKQRIVEAIRARSKA